MGEPAFPVLWICGPPCVGKSSVAWQLYASNSSVATTAYVDIDQLGMCCPLPGSDDGELVKAQNLGSVLRNFQAFGAASAVVSGVLAPAALAVYLGQCRGMSITFCRLTAARETLVERNAARGRRPEQIDEAVRHADAMDRDNYAHVTVDTHGRTVAEIVRLARDETVALHEPRPTIRRPAPGQPAAIASAAGGGVLALCGAKAIGKSTVGFSLFLQSCDAGIPAAYVDLEQIAFVRPTPADDPLAHRLRAANLVAMRSTFSAAGVDWLIATGVLSSHADIHVYRNALAPSELTVGRLHADRESLRERVFERAVGAGPPLAGDDLVHQPPEVLAIAAARAHAEAEALSAAALGDFWVDTSGRSPGRSVQDVRVHLASQMGDR